MDTHQKLYLIGIAICLLLAVGIGAYNWGLNSGIKKATLSANDISSLSKNAIYTYTNGFNNWQGFEARWKCGNETIVLGEYRIRSTSTTDTEVNYSKGLIGNTTALGVIDSSNAIFINSCMLLNTTLTLSEGVIK